MRTVTSAAVDGGAAACTLSGTKVRLDQAASPLDDAYNDRYIKFTTGFCKGRWTKITDYEGPGKVSGLYLDANGDPAGTQTTTVVTLPSSAAINRATADGATADAKGNLCVIAGTNAGECRPIASVDTTSQYEVTVGSAFSAAMDATSYLRISGDAKCATLYSDSNNKWSDGQAECTTSANDNYKLTGGWQVIITNGTCKGQFRRVANFEPEPALDTHDNKYGGGGIINVDAAWDTSSRVNGAGPYGEIAVNNNQETISYNYSGCTMPDNTSEFSLIPAQKAPGSIASVDNTFGVRWAGFINPTSTTEYTFLVQMPNAAAGQERVKLWLDNKLVIDQWTSLSGCLPSATVAFAGSGSMLYDLQMEYKRLQNSVLPPRVKLTWLNSRAGSEVGPGSGGMGDSKGVEPKRLLTNIAVPNNQVVYVDPAGTESRASSVSGNGLTTATAGMQASFTITSRDQYANLRDIDEDSYIIHVHGPTTRMSVNAEPVVATPGTYSVTHLPTESGDYSVSVQRAQPGGLASEWFNNMWMMGEAADSTVSDEVNYDWGKQFVTYRTAKETKTGNDYVSIRWKGYFKAELSEIYTFHVKYQDGLVMYLDSTKVIDNWDGVNATGDTTSPDYVEPFAEARATLAATAERLYPITIEYREVTGNASCRLFYSSASVAHSIIPSGRLYHSATHAFGSPFKLYVNPAATCGSQSILAGAGLSHVTAGTQAAFTIQARDVYANTKTKWDDTFVVRSAAAAAVGPDALGNYGALPFASLSKHGTISADVTKGRYAVRYTPTAAAAVTIFSSLVVPGGVFATYYDGVSPTYYTLPLKAGTVEQIKDDKGLTVPSVSSYTVRWSGLFRPTVVDTHTFTPFTTGRTDKSDRVRLWIDSKLIIDQWTSLAAALPAATLSFPVANEYYELQMHYQTTELTSWGSLTSKMDSNAAAAVASSSLFQSSHAIGSPFTVTTSPAPTDFPKSIIYGEGLTVATAGVASEFKVQAKDTFRNLRMIGGDNIQAQLSSVGTGAVVNPVVTDNDDGTYTGSFTPTTQGLYDLSVYLGSSVKTTQLLVEPGHICASTSYSNGQALTAATAGFTATFTIQSKDAFNNLRSVGNDNLIVRLTGPNSEEHNVRSTYIGAAPSSNLGRFTVSFRATQSGDFKLDVKAATANGLNVKYFRDVSLSQQADEAVVCTRVSFPERVRAFACESGRAHWLRGRVDVCQSETCFCARLGA